MKDVYVVIHELESTDSKNEKVEILKSLDDESRDAFLNVADAALSNAYDYNIKKGIKDLYQKNKVREINTNITYSDLVDYFVLVSSIGGFKNNKMKEELSEFVSSLPPNMAEVAIRILKRSLDCGVSAKSINKAFPGAIFEAPYMRAHPINEKTKKKISFPCSVQTKMDGQFVNILLDPAAEDCIDFRSRDWQDLTGKYLTDELIEFSKENPLGRVVLHGEVVVLDDEGNIMSRSEGNGYINSDEVDSSRLLFVLWDAIPADDFFKGESKVSYYERFYKLLMPFAQEINKYCTNVKLADNFKADSWDDVVRIFKEQRSKGEEGVMVKERSAGWKNHTSPYMLKFKQVSECEMKVIGWKEGTGKYEGMIGAIEVVSADGKVHNFVGSGFSDKQRKDIKAMEDAIEREAVVGVQYNDVTTNELKPDMYSLYCPRFTEIRFDKQDADGYDYIAEQLEKVDI